MHEISLVRSLLAQVLTAAEPLPASMIHRVIVSVGPLTGVEPLLVAQAFSDLRAEFGLDSCELEIEESHLEGNCLKCNHNFNVVDFVFCCPKCDSHAIRVTQGDGFFLLRLEVEEIDSTLGSRSVQDDLSERAQICSHVAETVKVFGALSKRLTRSATVDLSSGRCVPLRKKFSPTISRDSEELT